MTISRPSFTALPAEIQTLIIIQASLQDAAYRRERKNRSVPDLFMFISVKGWDHYGKSLMALYSTCKLLRGLASPYVFKTLKLTEATTGLFHVFMKERYALCFETLEIDGLRVEESESDDDDYYGPDGGTNMERYMERRRPIFKDFFLSTVPLLKNIKHLSFEWEDGLKLFLDLLPKLDACEWSDYDTREVAVAKQVAKRLAQSVTSITFQRSTTWKRFITALPERLPNLREVFIEASDGHSSDQYGLPNLLQLTSLSIDLYSTMRRPTPGLSSKLIGPTWASQSVLRDLHLKLPVVHTSEWRFVLNFSANLASLSFNFQDWKVDPGTFPERFPSLQKLILQSERDCILKVLDRIAAPTRLAKLQITLRPPKEAQEDTEDDLSLHVALCRFLTPMLHLEVVNLAEEITDSARSEFNLFFKRKRFGDSPFRATLSSPPAWKSWQDDKSEKRGRKIDSSQAIAFLDYVRGKIEQTDLVGDERELEDWIGWMGPLTGRRVLEDH